MKHRTSLPLLAILSVCAFAAPAECQESPRALLFIRGGSADWEFMLNREAGVIYSTLQEAGIEVQVATVSGDPISAGSVNFTPDLRLSDVNVSEFAAFVLPCMAAGDYVVPGAVAMVREAAAEGKIVAAQYNSVFTLAEAGLLKGKNYAHRVDFSVDQYPAFEDAQFAGGGVVRDGNIITSGICPYMARQRGVPDQTEEFAMALAESIKG